MEYKVAALETMTTTSERPTTAAAPRPLPAISPLARIGQASPLAAALFAFWVVLSGKLDAFHLGAGALSAAVVTALTHRLLLLPPPIARPGVHPAAATPWLRLALYLPWLAGQVVLSSLHVAWVVLHPKMPIRPRLVRFRSGLPTPIARLTLANSITLTPGTVTLDVEDDAFLVHALTEHTARSLTPEGGETMQKRVAAIFGTAEEERP